MNSIDTLLIIKATHICFVIFWMAGMLYLPRLFVYHTTAAYMSEKCQMLQQMEAKLMRIIMLPAIIVVFITGLYMFYIYGGFHGGKWLHVKLTLGLIMGAIHGFLSKCRKNFARGTNPYSGKFFRILNEVPSILTIIIVFTAVIKF